MTYALAFLGAYLIGAIPFGYLVARMVKGVDIREHGSRNIGATNVARVCGRGWGVFVFALDFLKGAAPLLFLMCNAIACYGPRGEGAAPWHVRLLLSVNTGVLAFAGLGAILGHMFPVYLRLRGGKGVATAGGVFAVLAPWPTVIAVAAWAVCLAAFRYVSLASICAAFALGMSQLLADPRKSLGERLPVTVFALAMMVLVIARHRANVGRLVAGTEPRIGSKGPAAAGEASPGAAAPATDKEPPAVGGGDGAVSAETPKP